MAESILNSYFLVDFADNYILHWGTGKDMLSMQNSHYAGTSIVKYNDLTKEMKDSISLYTHGLLDENTYKESNKHV
jgi:hypothetical protein